MNSLSAFVFLFLLLSATLAQGTEQRESFSKTITKEVHTGYLVVQPEGFDPHQKYPLLIFLHGRGESGEDLDKVKIHGPYKKVAELKLPLLIAAPQTPIDEYWDTDMLEVWVEHLLDSLPVDRSRVYLTGLSLGGMGTWDLAVKRPDLFAAIAPICGRGKKSQAKNLVGLPVWAFHGAKDDVVPMTGSIEMINAIYEAGGDARLTIYPEANHNSWEATYDNPKLYEWFLKQEKTGGPKLGQESGWRELFDGKSLDGWTQKNGTATYHVEDGTIVGASNEGSPNSFLCTDREYGDFELEFDVKVDEALNSGVQIRSTTAEVPPEEDAAGNFGRVNGPQVEIAAGGDEGSVAGYVYGEATDRGWLTPDARRKPHEHFRNGEWNHYRIVAKGPRIQTWINGAAIEDLTDEPIYRSHPKGFIALQVHAVPSGEGPYEVAWRNLRLRELRAE